MCSYDWKQNKPYFVVVIIIPGDAEQKCDIWL